MKKVIGMDLGDKAHVVVVLDESGEEVLRRSVGNTAVQVQRFFSKYPGAAVAMEAGTHSPWISRLLESMGLEVLIGNPRKLRAIWDCDDKSDERDARLLALIYRLEPRLLHAIEHRGEQAAVDLEYLKGRDVLVNARCKLINHVRAAVKSVGCRIASCSSQSFHKKAPDQIPELLKPALTPVMEAIEQLTSKIKEMDEAIKELCETRYPVTELLMEIRGVGPVTALAFVLTIDDPDRFSKSRQVGPYLGLTPKRDQSGESDKQLSITKAGNGFLRRLLINCSHYILGAHGPDCDLRRHGERVCGQGGKSAKKRAVVAVARKLAVVMHRLWSLGAVYKPFVNEPKAA